MRTYRDNYPTGRKQCPRCGWRLCVYFTVREWADPPECTVPLTINSVCSTCTTIYYRERRGYGRRTLYPHGVPGSKKNRDHIREMNRKSRKRRMKNQTYRDETNEYRRIWANAKHGTLSRPGPNGRPPSGPEEFFPREPLIKWIRGWIAVRGLTTYEFEGLVGVGKGTLKPGRKRISRSTVDKIFNAIDRTEVPATLWPETW